MLKFINSYEEGKLKKALGKGFSLAGLCSKIYLNICTTDLIYTISRSALLIIVFLKVFSSHSIIIQ